MVGGCCVGAGTMLYVLAIVLHPVTQELGISRKSFSTGILVSSVAMALASPLLGSALDRWGIRRVLLPAIACSALAAAALSTLTASMLHIVGLFAVWGALATSISPVPFARAVSERFEAKRGLALGVAICGAGLGTILVPPAVAALVQSQGWRTTFVIYGVAIVVLALLPTALVIRGHKAPEAADRNAAANGAAPVGISLSEAVRTRRFWTLVAASLLGIVAINGSVTHLTALLIDRGVPMAQATVAVSVIGAGQIIGRLLCGWMLDRVQGPRVAVIFFGLPAIGVMLLAGGGALPIPLIAAFLLGLGVGGEVDMLAYFTGRYFGMKAFGRIYGLLFALFTIGAGLGPFLSGAAFEIQKSYDQIFLAYQLILLACCGLVWSLGPYRYAAHSGTGGHAAEEDDPETAVPGARRA
jgi:MFS family permease